MPAARAEGPVAVPPEVVVHRDHERQRSPRPGGARRAPRRRPRTRTGSPRSPSRRRRRTSSAGPSCAACAARRARGGARHAGGRRRLLSPRRSRGQRYTEVLEHQRRHVARATTARAPAASMPQSSSTPSRVVAVQRAVAAAAHVVGAAPVDELVAGRRPRRARRRRAGTRAPTRAGRARPGRSRCRTRPPRDVELERAGVALDAPAAPAPVGQVAAGREAQLARARRARRASSPSRGVITRSTPSASSSGRRRAATSSSRRVVVERVDHRRARRGHTRELGLLGAGSRRASARAQSAKHLGEVDRRSSTGVCEWSDMTITACSSRNASGPPATCMIRSSARSASAIERDLAVRARPCASGCRCRAARRAGSRTGRARPGRRPTQPVWRSRWPGMPSVERAARVARVEQVGVEQLARAVDRVAELRRLRDAAVDARARRARGGCGRGRSGRWCRRCAGRRRPGARRPSCAPGSGAPGSCCRPCRRASGRSPKARVAAKRRAVLHVALLAAVVPVHRRDVVVGRADAGRDRGRRHRGRPTGRSTRSRACRCRARAAPRAPAPGPRRRPGRACPASASR